MEGHGDYITIWQAAKCHLALRTPEILPQRVELINKTVDKLMARFQNYHIAETAIFREYGIDRDQLGLPSNFDTLSPCNRTHAIASATTDGVGCNTFTKAAERLDIIRTAQGSLRAVDSGIRRYFRFSAVRGKYPPPATEAAVSAWSCISEPYRVYRNYIAHLKKSSLLMELDTRWETPSAKSVALGMGGLSRPKLRIPPTSSSQMTCSNLAAKKGRALPFSRSPTWPTSAP